MRSIYTDHALFETDADYMAYLTGLIGKKVRVVYPSLCWDDNGAVEVPLLSPMILTEVYDSPDGWITHGSATWEGRLLTGVALDTIVEDATCCSICHCALDDPADPLGSADCGGDCTRCMAEAGDPDAIAALQSLPKSGPASS